MAYLKGIDVSKWQDSTDWSPTGLTFIVARASIGLTKDPEYADHIAKAKAAGLLTGAYHFNWDADDAPGFTGTPEQQARFFVDAAGDVDFLFLDVEGAQAFEADEATAFIAEVHRLGKKVGLYMSASVFKWNWGQDYDWVAKWSSTQPSGDWEFWQYTSSGTALDGGRLDLDYTNETIETLRALSNKEYDTAMPTITNYIPGQTVTVKPASNIRNAPVISGNTPLRAVGSAGETWVITGWVTGAVDPDSGSNQWVVWWGNGRWEYTAKVNLASGPTDLTPIAKADYDRLVTERDTAKAALTKAQADLTAAQASLTAAQATIADLNAALVAAKTSLDTKQRALEAAQLELTNWLAFRDAATKVGL